MNNGTMERKSKGDKMWRLNGELHRTDGPALECVEGTKEWWLNGVPHRTDGPAIEWENGSKFWYINGQRHRTDGPAVELSAGFKGWWLKDMCYGSGEEPPAEYVINALLYHGLQEMEE